MSRLRGDMRAFARMYMRSRAGMFFTFLFPILLILCFGAIFSNNSSPIPLPVQNLDGGQASVEFMDALNHTGVNQIQVIPASENLNSYISNNSASIALQIPANFTSDLDNRMTDPHAPMATATLFGDPSKTVYQQTLGTTNGAAEAMNFHLANATSIVAVQAQTIPSVKGSSYMDFFLPGVVGMTVMTVSLFGMTNICSNYRSKGYFKLLATTTIKKHEWMLSKFVVYSIILIASLLVSYMIGVAAFGMTSSLTVLTFAFILAGAFMFVSMGMLIGVGIKDEESGVAIANAIGFPMMFLSGSFFSVQSFPGFLQGVAAFMPLTYLNNGLRDTMIYGNDASALLNLAVVLVVGVIMMITASRLMSWKEA